MKKKTLLLMLTILMSINAWGAKAFPGPYTFTQPERSTLPRLVMTATSRQQTYWRTTMVFVLRRK